MRKIRSRHHMLITTYGQPCLTSTARLAPFARLLESIPRDSTVVLAGSLLVLAATRSQWLVLAPPLRPTTFVGESAICRSRAIDVELVYHGGKLRAGLGGRSSVR